MCLCCSRWRSTAPRPCSCSTRCLPRALIWHTCPNVPNMACAARKMTRAASISHSSPNMAERDLLIWPTMTSHRPPGP
eukprot:5885553-Prymnesium_polylepis.1